jgi:biopolymer transport protein ExbD
MQMNGSGSDPGLQSEINITPLVDVVLVLLIIFMVVVPMLLHGYDVSIPQASSETVPTEAEMTQVVLAVGEKDCQLFQPPSGEGLPANCLVSLDARQIPVTELPARIGEALSGRPKDQRVLFLAADDRLNYEVILRIVDLAKSGVEDLRIEFVTD